MDNILANYGQVVPPMARPIDLAWMYSDPTDATLEVLLVSCPSSEPTATPSDSHWHIAWQVKETEEYSVYRRLHVVQELGFQHLTNWGPITKIANPDTLDISDIAVIAPLTYSQRQALEHIASETLVHVPNGMWNCQDWVKAVFKAAEAAGIFTRKQWSDAVDAVDDAAGHGD